MRVLILGGSGFIGKSVINSLLVERVSVLVVSRSQGAINEKNDIRFVQSSMKMAIHNQEILNFNPDWIINLAGSSHPRSSAGKETFELEEYVLPFFKLLDELYKKSKNLNVIFASSAGAIYKSAQENRVKDYIDTPYCASKLSIEHYLSSFVISRENTTAFTLRISNPIGIIDKEGFGIVNVFSKAVIGDRKVELIGDYKNSKDYIAIEDVTSAILAALFSTKTGYYCLDVASGLSLNAKDIYQIIRGFKEKSCTTILPVKNNLNIKKTYEILGWRSVCNITKKINDVYNYYDQ